MRSLKPQISLPRKLTPTTQKIVGKLLRGLEGIEPMTRFSMHTGFLVLACVVSGCCYQGSPYCHLNYPNLIGYTYPNWCPPPLKTPPNGPPDEVLEALKNTENTMRPMEEIPAGSPTPIPNGNAGASILSVSRR